MSQKKETYVDYGILFGDAEGRHARRSLPDASLIMASRIKPDPNQPRKTGKSKKGIRELAASIKEHGILQPILVKYVKDEDYFQIISGERRYWAAISAGLREIPCIVRDVSDDDAVVKQLVENLQREDLLPLEEAEGYSTLIEKYNFTHSDIAEKVGKSRVTITETLSLNNLHEDIKRECRTSDIYSKSMLLQVVRAGSYQKQMSLWQEIKGRDLTVQSVKTAIKKKKKGGRPVNFKYTINADDNAFSVTVHFNKPKATEEEILNALRIATEKVQAKI